MCSFFKEFTNQFNLFQLKQCSPSNWSKTGSLPGVSMTTFIFHWRSFFFSILAVASCLRPSEFTSNRWSVISNLLRCGWRGSVEFNTSREDDKWDLTTVANWYNNTRTIVALTVHTLTLASSSYHHIPTALRLCNVQLTLLRTESSNIICCYWSVMCLPPLLALP